MKKTVNAKTVIETIFADAASRLSAFEWRYDTTGKFMEAYPDAFRCYSVAEVDSALFDLGIRAERKNVGGVVRTARKLPFPVEV